MYIPSVIICGGSTREVCRCGSTGNTGIITTTDIIRMAQGEREGESATISITSPYTGSDKSNSPTWSSNKVQTRSDETLD